MNYLTTTRMAALGAAVFCATLVLTPNSAQAASHFDIGVGIGAAPVYQPNVVCEGHYESRTQRVLVLPERRERQWVDAVYETRYFNGRPQTVCVAQAGWREFVVPAQYEDRIVQVWVPGCVAYYPRYVAPSFGFGFDYRSRH